MSKITLTVYFYLSSTQVIKEALEKLNEWEKAVDDKLISRDLFLTRQTAEGLRVTLKSTLELIDYLTKDCGFPYVLTGRINQDCLEVWTAVFFHA